MTWPTHREKRHIIRPIQWIYIFMKWNIFLKFRFANFSSSFELFHRNCASYFKTETSKLKYSINSTENEKSRAIESCYSHHIYITTQVHSTCLVHGWKMFVWGFLVLPVFFTVYLHILMPIIPTLLLFSYLTIYLQVFSSVFSVCQYRWMLKEKVLTLYNLALTEFFT